jgi:hypothetical protein
LGRPDDSAPLIEYAVHVMSAGSNVDPIPARPILLVGAPRSGTTWLAKIFDSHPDVLYRHEPDEVVPSSGSIQQDVARWVRQHDARTAGKRPFFRKSWQAAPAGLLRTTLAYAGAAAERIGLPRLPIPDMGDLDSARAVIKSVRLCTNIGDFTRAFPAGRAVLIVRHPCGQVASVMRGAWDGRFALAQPGTDMPFDEAAAMRFAARHGVDRSAFQCLPDAAKYAWSWREFNESAWTAVSGQSNARVVVYEDLCTRPVAQAQAILAFAGLTWHAQTEAFLARSTGYDGVAGYYAVVRNSITAAERWRTAMEAEDQDAVRAVVRGSPLVSYWPDLAA